MTHAEEICILAGLMYDLRRPKRLPGLMLANTTLTEDMEMITPNDYLGNDFDETELQDELAKRKER